MTTISIDEISKDSLLREQLIQYPDNLVETLKLSLELADKSLRSKENGSSNEAKEEFIAPTDYLVRLSSSEQKFHFKKGLQLLQSGKIGVLLLAGGQGTRLGFDQPKGCYVIDGLRSSLFQMQAEQIKRLERLLSTSESSIEMGMNESDDNVQSTHNSNNTRPLIHWYIMTSPFTDHETRAYFEENHYFGLQLEQIHFFEQGSMPCMTEDGKLILESKDRIACSPNGNGGVYTSLEQAGMLKHMRENGIEGIHLYCVDNCLVKIADPSFMSLCYGKVKFAAKVIPKSYPEERVGVFGVRNGKLAVVEYSEMSPEMQKDTSFNQANIVNFYYSVDFLEECAKFVQNGLLPYHIARKAIPTFDDQGQRATIPGIKLELFNFDICHLAGDKFLLMEVSRSEEFAPLKNASGEPKDSPEVCRAMLSRRNILRLQKAGATVDIDLESVSDEDVPTCEISPLVTYDGEGLENWKGQHVSLPIFLHPTINVND